MKFDEIVQQLENDDVVMINGGEVMLKRKLSKMIGGIPCYAIMVDSMNEEAPLIFDTLDQLDDFSVANGTDIKRCFVCGELAEEGYFIDKENHMVFCCYSCIVEWFNKIYGKENWKPVGMCNMKIDQEQGEFMVKQINPPTDEDSYIYESGAYWKVLPIYFIPTYDFAEKVETIEEDDETDDLLSNYEG